MEKKKGGGTQKKDKRGEIQNLLDLIWFSMKNPPLSLCSSPAGLKNISAEPGQNVTLPCKAENNYTLIVLEWTRDGLEKKKVFVFKDGRPFEGAQHEFYRNRVFLNDSQTKDGDLSVVLKNVNSNDTGTFNCTVLHKNDPPGSPLNLISTINLQVFPPPDIAGIIVGVLVAVLVVGFLIYMKIRAQNQTPRDSNDQQNVELDTLNPDSNTENN
uniref:Ig-like domain-containing protein n=1 Tax=Oryzias melastigma TaxID=30732 RepID=A0A3B3BIV7_ORYME